MNDQDHSFAADLALAGIGLALTFVLGVALGWLCRAATAPATTDAHAGPVVRETTWWG